MRSVNLGRWSRRVEKLFNMKGGGGLLDVDPSVRAILPIASGVEERYLEGWNRYGVVAAQAAVAAQNSRVRIRNPVASNVMIVLEQLCVFVSAADNTIVAWGATTTDLLTLVPLTFTRMDPRGNPQPTAIVSTNAQASAGQALLQRSLLANQSVDFLNTTNQEIPVLPGQVVDIQASVVNINLTVTFIWRERALELSELT